MLEAAMLGIPYQARPSARTAAWTPSAPAAPEVVAQREIRNEQDAAYQESLMVCVKPNLQAECMQHATVDPACCGYVLDCQQPLQ